MNKLAPTWQDLPKLPKSDNSIWHNDHIKRLNILNKEKPKKYFQLEHGEADSARKECKARSVLNKFKEMETRALNGEPEEGKSRIN